MRTVLLCSVLLCSGCLLEPARTRSAAGWRFEYNRPPIVDITTPMVFDRDTGELTALEAEETARMPRLRRRRAVPLAEPALALPAPALPVIASTLAPPLPVCQPLPPALPVVRESHNYEETIRSLSERLRILEARVGAK